MADPAAPIGIFDSGVGGLTVFRELQRLLPGESLVYLGDTARVPYGTKSAQTVIRYAEACTRLLLERNIKLLVVACNTASAYALPALESQLQLPVVGVVLPGARAAVAATQTGRIGVIATPATVGSGAYQTAIKALQPGAEIYTQACPLFVPLAEEGWVSGEVPTKIAHHYLGALLDKTIDTLVLGCTHYPLLKATIQEVAGEGVRLIDSAEATAAEVRDVLAGKGLENKETAPKHPVFLVSDAPRRFIEVGSHFLGQTPQNVEWVDF